jgi:hypothetical protein
MLRIAYGIDAINHILIVRQPFVQAALLQCKRQGAEYSFSTSINARYLASSAPAGREMGPPHCSSAADCSNCKGCNLTRVLQVVWHSACCSRAMKQILCFAKHLLPFGSDATAQVAPVPASCCQHHEKHAPFKPTTAMVCTSTMHRTCRDGFWFAKAWWNRSPSAGPAAPATWSWQLPCGRGSGCTRAGMPQR